MIKTLLLSVVLASGATQTHEVREADCLLVERSVADGMRFLLDDANTGKTEVIVKATCLVDVPVS